MLQRLRVFINPIQDNGGYGKDQTFCNKTLLSQDMMKQVAMNTAISIFERVNKNKTECNQRSSEHGVVIAVS